MLEVGSVIDGKYKILNVIGRGGMSIVYLAMNERVNRQWAVKEILKRDAYHLYANRREIEMMKGLSHPHLPGIVDVIENRDALLIVMDYIEGRSLQELLQERGALPREAVLRWAVQLCDTLSYLHTRRPPIIYRDMKPSNVMLKPDGNVMLIDFGAAREYQIRKVKDTISLGTRGYAAPEQYEQEGHSDARTDIYCLGVMLFQLFTGESPHAVRPICTVDPSFSSGLQAILVKCTQIRKEDRYQSCSELLYALEHYWEWDVSYRREQKRKLSVFLGSAALSIFLGAGACFSGWKETDIRNHDYNACLLAAGNSVTKEDEILNYERAVQLDPSREEAYLALLEDAFLDDGLLTVEESGRLRRLLIAYGEGRETNEQLFRKNESGYEEFAYAAGIAYYYKYEEKGNKKYAKSYLEIAGASEHLESRKAERAERLGAVAGYYSRVGIVDEAGDASITYRTYWEDLVRLSAGNLVEADNERTAYVMYRELVGQIISRAEAFREDGVGQEEMLAQLEAMRGHLRTDFAAIGDDRRKQIEEELLQLQEYMERAEAIVRAAFAEEEQRNGNVSSIVSDLSGRNGDRDPGIRVPVYKA